MYVGMTSTSSAMTEFLRLTIWSKFALKMPPVFRISMMTTAGRMPGIVMCTSCFHRPAPSMRAAS